MTTWQKKYLDNKEKYDAEIKDKPKTTEKIKIDVHIAECEPNRFFKEQENDEIIDLLKIIDEEDENDNPKEETTKVPHFVREEVINEMYMKMDELLATHTGKMTTALNQHNTQEFMDVFTKIIETCVSDLAQLNKEDRKGFFGRNTLNVKYVKQEKARFDFDQNESFKNDPEQHRLRSQYSRMNHVRGCAKKLLLNKNLEIGYKHKIQYHIRKNYEQIMKAKKPTDGIDQICEHIYEHMSDDSINVLMVTKAADDLKKKCSIVDKHLAKKMKEKRRLMLEKETNHKVITRLIKANYTSPMSGLERDADYGEGKMKGTLATDEREFDIIAHKAWDEITYGAKGDLQEIADAFIKKYSHVLIRREEFKIADLDKDSFIKTCRVPTKSAPGIDGWHPSDLVLLSDNALGWLVEM